MRTVPTTWMTGPVRRYGSVVSAFMFAQASVAVAALLRIPFTVDAIGLSGLGTVAMISAAVPFLLIPGAGLLATARTLVAESIAGDRAAATRSLCKAGGRLARRSGLSLGVVSIVAWTLLRLRLGATSDVDYAIVCGVVLCALSLDGMWWWGAADGMGRPQTPSVIVGVFAWFGCVAALGLWTVGAPTGAFALVSVASSTGPAIAMSFAGRLLLRGMLARDSPNLETSSLESHLRRSLKFFSLKGLADSLTRGIDPLIVGSIVGGGAAGGYIVAQRLSMPITLVAVALLPRFVATSAYERVAGVASHGLTVRGTARSQALVATVLAVPFVLFGPWVARLFASSALDAPMSLYFGLAILGVLWSYEVPLSSVLVGPDALHRLVAATCTAGLVNLVASVFLTGIIGAAGPVYGSVLALGGLVCWERWQIRRHQSSLREPFGLVCEPLSGGAGDASEQSQPNATLCR